MCPAGFSTFISLPRWALDNLTMRLSLTSVSLLVSRTLILTPLSCVGLLFSGTPDRVLRSESMDSSIPCTVCTKVLGTFFDYACITDLCSTSA